MQLGAAGAVPLPERNKEGAGGSLSSKSAVESMLSLPYSNQHLPGITPLMQQDATYLLTYLALFTFQKAQHVSSKCQLNQRPRAARRLPGDAAAAAGAAAAGAAAAGAATRAADGDAADGAAADGAAAAGAAAARAAAARAARLALSFCAFS